MAGVVTLPRRAARQDLLLPMLALGLLWAISVKTPPDSGGITDLPTYQAAARHIADGQWPYRDFFFEYPPGAAGLFAVGGWIYGLTDQRFLYGMAIEMLVFAWLGQYAAARLAPPRWSRQVAWGWCALPVLLGTLVRERFDVAPTAIVLLALLAFVRDRPRLGFVLLGIGGAVKLFPLAIAPIAVVWLLGAGRRGEAWKGVAICAAVFIACCAPFFALSPRGFTKQFSFHLDRPVQIESTPATVLFALRRSVISGVPGTEDRFRSQGLIRGPANTVKTLFSLLQVLVFAGIVWAAWRAARAGPDGDPELLLLGAFGVLLAFVALGKVFSTQYMIWLLAAALVIWAHGRSRLGGLVLAATVLSAAYYPHHYVDLITKTTSHSETVAVVAARNGLLVAALAGVAFVLVRGRPVSPPAEP